MKIIESKDANFWCGEVPPGPVVTFTFDGGYWIVYCDDEADHSEFEETWYRGHHQKDEAKNYAKEWAKAINGSWYER